MNPHVKAAIAAIRENAWTPIQYRRAIWDAQLACWVSDAEVAETHYTAFTSKKGKAITARLIVRRVKDLNHKAGEGQDELFTVWRYHAVFTDSPFVMLQAEAQHRDHAVVEQVFADWTDGPLAHLPSGSFPANAAWLTLAAISHNLLRAVGALASLTYAKARAATIRRPIRYGAIVRTTVSTSGNSGNFPSMAHQSKYRHRPLSPGTWRASRSRRNR